MTATQEARDAILTRIKTIADEPTYLQDEPGLLQGLAACLDVLLTDERERQRAGYVRIDGEMVPVDEILNSVKAQDCAYTVNVSLDGEPIAAAVEQRANRTTP